MIHVLCNEHCKNEWKKYINFFYFLISEIEEKIVIRMVPNKLLNSPC
jgi:hypothetical protein